MMIITKDKSPGIIGQSQWQASWAMANIIILSIITCA